MSDQLYRRTVNNPIAEGVNVTVTMKDGTIIDGHVHWVPVEPDYEAATRRLDSLTGFAVMTGDMAKVLDAALKGTDK